MLNEYGDFILAAALGLLTWTFLTLLALRHWVYRHVGMIALTLEKIQKWMEIVDRELPRRKL